MEKKSISLILLYSLVIVFSSLMVFWHFNTKSKIVFYDSNKLFSEFRMTKEFTASGKKELDKRNRKLDSLKNVVSLTVNQNDREAIIQELISENDYVQNFKNNYSAENSEKIWKRINQYIKEYSQNKGYEFILGNQYGGQAFYGDAKNDITVELLNFINKKYEGFN